MFQQLSHMAQDVGTQLTGKGRNWTRAAGYLGGANIVYGFLTVVWVLLMMRGHGSQWLGAALGAFRTAADPRKSRLTLPQIL